MKLSHKVRSIWHYILFSLLGKNADDFIMSCREVIHQVDTHSIRPGFIGHLRHYSHLSVCQACTNYKKFSDFISKKFSALVVETFSNEELQEINKRLVVKIRNQ